MNNNVSIIRRCEMSFIRTRMEQYGLLPLEGKLLALLGNGSCTQEELGLQLHLDKGRIAKAIASLEGKGYIGRCINEENRRQKLVSLTQEGESMLAQIAAIFEAWDEICYTGFTEEEIQAHKDCLKRMAENAIHYHNHKGGSVHG